MKSTFFYIALWGLVCVAALAGYGFWYSTVADASAAVANVQSQIDARTEASRRVASARAALTEIAGDEALVQSYFVPDTGVVNLIDDLESRARVQKSAIKVLSVSTGGSATQSSLTLQLTLSIDGTFDAVMRTVGSIEYAPYDLSVTKLAVQKSGKDAWHATMEIVVGSVARGATASTTSAGAQTPLINL